MAKVRICIALIVLVVSMPIYSSIALAALQITEIHGSDFYDNYVKEDDQLEIEAFAMIGNERVNDRSLVRFGGMPYSGKYQQSSPGIMFDSCVDGTCRLSLDPSMYAVSPNPGYTNVYLYGCAQQDCSLVEQDSEQIVLDDRPPDIDIMLEKSKVGSTGLDIRYAAEDRACDGVACEDLCSGISRIEFHSSKTGLLHTEQINGEPDFCVKTGTTSISAQELQENDIIYAIVYDNLGTAAQSSSLAVSVDLIAPLINTTSLVITDELGGDGSAVPETMFKIGISIEITDDDLNISSVRADLSDLNPYLGAKQADSCSSYGADTYRCRWDDVQLDIDSDTDALIHFTAADIAGNLAEAPANYLFDIDNSLPQVNAILTGHMRNGVKYLGRNDIVIVEIDSAGAGFNSANVFMELSEVRRNVHDAKAENCSEDSYWYCYFDVNPNQPEGVHEIEVKGSSLDDFGKGFERPMRENVTVDVTKPAIADVGYSPSFPTPGDDITFSFRIADENGADAFIDASSVSTESFPKTADCNGDGLCTVSVGSLVSSFTNATVRITAEDYAGNEADPAEIYVAVFNLENTGAPNCFSVSSVESIPGRIDKKTASQVSMDVFAQINLNRICPNTEVIGYDADCSGMQNIVAEPYIVDAGPFIGLKTSAAIGFEDSFDINCRLSIMQRVGNSVYAQPEIENISKSVQLYGRSIGDMEESIEGKLAQITAEIQDIDSEIEEYQKIIDIWGTWCQISEGLGILNAMLQGIKSAAYTVLSGAWVACFGLIEPDLIIGCMATVSAAWTAICQPLSFNQVGIIEKFIWPPGILPDSLLGIIGWINKGGCMIGFHCALCDWGTYLSVSANFLGNWVGSMSADWIETNFNDLTRAKPKGLQARAEPGSSKWERLKKLDTFMKEDPGYKMWKQRAPPTKIEDTGTWIFDPYKSIHYAKACLCLPAYVYNLRKSRQIKCMYRTCIMNSIASGTSITQCDIAYKERECLYVESASFRKHGYVEGFFDSLWEAIVNMWPSLLNSIGYQIFCFAHRKSGGLTCARSFIEGVPKAGWYDTTCGLWGGANIIMEIYGLLSSEFSFLNYDNELEGQDYCGG